MELFAEMVRSKKFVALLVGILAAVGAKLGLDAELSNELSRQIVALVATYMIGQGIADNGKEAAKVAVSSIPRHAQVAQPQQNEE